MARRDGPPGARLEQSQQRFRSADIARKHHEWIIVSDAVATPGPSAVSRRQVLERHTHLRDDHLRYMQKWGLIQPSHRAHGEVFYAFGDLATIRQADAELGEGASFRAVLRNLLASRHGQLTFDFRLDARPAKILQLKRPEAPPLAALMGATHAG